MTVLSPTGYPTRPQLQHVFAAGLRFDTVVEYLDDQGRWRPLCSDEDTPNAAPPSLMEQVLGLLREKPPTLPDSLASWRDWVETMQPSESWRVQEIVRPLTEWQSDLLHVLAVGGLVLVKLALPKAGSRWMLVTGLECEEGGLGLPRLRSLLVLDPDVSPVWACGHNARVSLSAGRSQGSGKAVALKHKLCIYRTLDGGYAACTVEQLVAIRPR